MCTEVNALRNRSTSDLVPMPSVQKLIDCRWVYTLKGAHSSIDYKFKARLVAKGFKQTFGIEVFWYLCFSGQHYFYSPSIGYINT